MLLLMLMLLLLALLLLLLLLASQNPIEHFAMKRALWSKRVEQQRSGNKAVKKENNVKHIKVEQEEIFMHQIQWEMAGKSTEKSKKK